MISSERKSVKEILGRSPIHPFPARMAPGIALDALRDSQSPLRVLDPMAGSGTVLAVARAQGHHAIGFDMDPLSVLLAKVWTTSIVPAEIVVRAEKVLQRARLIFEKTSVRESYPPACDLETRKFIRFWFDGYARRQLFALSTAIGRVRDDVARDLIWAAFSRLIITKSNGVSLAMDISHSRPHRAYQTAPTKPFRRFMEAVRAVAKNCPSAANGKVGPRSFVKRGDARNLRVKPASIDLVLTSPPYLNAIDYLRCSKFSLVWMGHDIDDLREIRRNSVGSECKDNAASNSRLVKRIIGAIELSPSLSIRNSALLEKYVWDMNGALSEASRVLKNGGRAVYVVGDSSIRGTFVSNSKITEIVAENNGLSCVDRQVRELPENRRYLPPPRSDGTGNEMDRRMKTEVVLSFVK